jgi:hypothetical protein
MDDGNGRRDAEGRDIGPGVKGQREAKGSGSGRRSLVFEDLAIASALSMNRELMNRVGHQHGRGEAILGIWPGPCPKNIHICTRVYRLGTLDPSVIRTSGDGQVYWLDHDSDTLKDVPSFQDTPALSRHLFQRGVIARG